jgi:PmbA protein
MLGEKEIRTLLESVLSRSTADQTEALFLGQDTFLTRFANSYIHQNVSESNAQLRVRIVQGNRVGVASTNDLTPSGVSKVVQTAESVAKLSPEQPDLAPLPEPKPIEPVRTFSQKTASFSADERAKAVGVICKVAQDSKYVASGAFTTSAGEMAVANSLGLFAYHPSTEADLVTVVMADDSSGYAQRTSWNVEVLDAEELAGEACNKVLLGRNPTTIEPGQYNVVLEEYAVADIVRFLSYMGFGAQAVQEGRSFMAGKFGKIIADPRITIVDDGRSPYGLPQPFDYEGVPKKRVEIILAGVANAVVYDSYTAKKEGKESTGHALPQPNAFGPRAANLFLLPGTDTKRAMLEDMKKGLWVTRFHYVNPVHPLKAILTGMTRDGTFLVENGEVVAAVKNLRFTQSMLEMLNKVEMVGKSYKLIESVRVPPLKVRDFTFTGVTEF